MITSDEISVFESDDCPGVYEWMWIPPGFECDGVLRSAHCYDTTRKAKNAGKRAVAEFIAYAATRAVPPTRTAPAMGDEHG